MPHPKTPLHAAAECGSLEAVLRYVRLSHPPTHPPNHTRPTVAHPNPLVLLSLPIHPPTHPPTYPGTAKNGLWTA